jgi:hypothetical protein
VQGLTAVISFEPYPPSFNFSEYFVRLRRKIITDDDDDYPDDFYGQTTVDADDAVVNLKHWRSS